MKIMIKIFSFLIIMLMTGCVTQKKVLYLQDLDKNDKLEINNGYDLKITYDDLLGISVHSRNPELTVPFTLQSGGSAGTSAPGASGGSAGQIQYLVDSHGNIDFPVLGSLHVVGMTRLELTNYIRNRLIEEDYIKDPIVIVKFLNFKVAVLGDIGAGVINVTSDRITIFEAISQSGDLAITGRRHNVMVLREENGTRVPYYLDLRSKEVFNSPCYYLKQNDMIYVEPNRTSTKAHNATEFKSFGTWMGFFSFIASMVTLILVAE